MIFVILMFFLMSETREATRAVRAAIATGVGAIRDAARGRPGLARRHRGRFCCGFELRDRKPVG